MFDKRLGDLRSAIDQCVYSEKRDEITPEEALKKAQQLLLQTREAEGIVYVVGNGGSAGIASHFCIDLLNTLKIPSNTLTDSNVATCIANDYGYEYVYSRPLDTMMHERDLLVAISSSGKSENIVNAAKAARHKGARVLTLSGFAYDNPLRELGDLNFWLDSHDYGTVETGHFFLLHTIIDSLSLNTIEQNEREFVHVS